VAIPLSSGDGKQCGLLALLSIAPPVQIAWFDILFFVLLASTETSP